MVFHCMDVSESVYLLISSRTFVLFPVLVITSKAAIDTHVQVLV